MLKGINNHIEILEIFALNENKLLNSKIKLQIINESTMKKISTTDTPCEILVIAKTKEYNLKNFEKANHIILLDSISDPGNLGTIIRSAAAFNIDGIILYGNCVELYSPKVIRSATGNLFKTPIIHIKSKEIIENSFKEHIKVATSLSKENNISISDCVKLYKYIIMFGSEANGLSKELTDIAQKNIRINMAKNVESLNLSVSSSIVMYELYNYKNQL